MARANSSRDRILTVAESIILQKGFGGTSIEEILEKASITKGGFFYHFSGKAELARALVEKYLETDDAVFRELAARARSLSEDPLQQLLIFLKLMAEMVGGMTEVHPGCLVAGFSYEMQQFDEETKRLMERGMLAWRATIVQQLERILEKYQPRVETSVDTLADMFTAVLEGGIILARVFNSNQALIDQVHAYRAHIRLVFGDV